MGVMESAVSSGAARRRRGGRSRWLSAAVFLVLSATAAAAAGLPSAAAVSPAGAARPARLVQVRGERALQLPCGFASSGADRCSWDLPVAWDLRTAPGISLRWLCTDVAPVSQFSVYLRAGGVWHAAKVSLGTPGRWQTVQVLKTDTSPEGTPRGWGQVDRVRIAAWRGGARDTTLYLADLDRLRPNVGVAILRGGATVAAAERGAAQSYARNVMNALASAGVLPACIDDSDVAVTGFAGYRLVLLPYHPNPSASLTRQLIEHAAAGGRVVGFYTLPAGLGEALGLRTGAYIRGADIPGGLGGMQFDAGRVRGLPTSLRQDSGNALDLVPTGHGMRALGWWVSGAGSRTAHTAAVLGSRGAWFGHVYLARDSTHGRQALLAIAGHFLPEVWERAASHQMANVTAGIAEGSFESIIEPLLARRAGPADSQAALRQARDLYRTAQSMHQSGRYPECVAALDRCRDQLARGLLTAQQPAPSHELRGAWCHRGYGIAGQSWEQTAGQMAVGGLNTLFVNVADGGKADYASAVLAPSPTYRQQGDQLQAALAACTRRGIAVHAWKLCFNLGDKPVPEQLARWRREGRLQRSPGGVDRDWLCPSHPENRRLEARAAAEMVTRYPGLAGVHLDFIRFPSSAGCTCEACRKGFEATLGRRLSGWPDVLRRDPALAQPWADYRRLVVTETVRQVAEAVRQVRPGARVSAAVFSNWSSARETVAQDWVLWAKRGYVDFVCPMNYHADAEAQRSDIARQAAWLRGSRAGLYPGIGVSTARLDALGVTRQIAATRAAGTGGFVLFELNRREAEEILPALGGR